MLTKIQKWGNSLAFRIPKSFAVEAGLENNSPVELSLVDGKLVLKQVVAPQWNLDALLNGITEDNRHAEIESGAPLGNEVW